MRAFSGGTLRYILTAALCLAGLAPTAGGKDFLWRVRTNDSIVYLAGSFHRLRVSDVSNPPFPIASFEEAFAQSEQVVFEANPHPDDQEAVDRHYARRATFPPGGGSLRAILAPHIYYRVRSLLIADGAPPSAIDRFRPWFVALVLADIYGKRRGFELAHGIDTRYYELAGAQGKTRLYLETPFEHVNVLASTPQHEWARGIEGQLVSRGREYVTLLEIYKNGDAEALAGVVNRQARTEPGIVRGLLARRNYRWLPKIESYLQQGRTTMVIVGAAHLVRGNGLIALLENRGYEVVRLPEEPVAVAAEARSD